MDPSASSGPPTAVAHGSAQQSGSAAQPGRQAHTDGFAVATLVSGIVPAIPVTLVLGPVALTRISRTGARGRSLAITGLVLAGLWAIAAAIAGTAFLTHHHAAKPATLPHFFRLHTGQCIDSGQNGISTVTVLSCARPHDAEVFGTFQVAGHRYPGAAAVQQQADRGCAARLSGYLNPQLSVSSLTESYVYPDAGAWAAGERTVVCTVRSASGQLTGSVRAAPG
ncbi:MAG TPA: septum formation family protein [Streptosporangiaceae bacterium]|nr:septum formation family protein [Streptosporangiaceae bacterium]